MTNPDNIVRVRARNGGRASVYEANGWAQAYSMGLLEGNGVTQNTSADMNVLVGGSASKPDVVLAENASGYKIALDLVGQQAIAITAPASNSRISAIVAYTDDLSLSTTEDTVTGSPASCGLIVVNGTASVSPSEPSDAQIRSAITSDGGTGSQAAYCVVATILVANDTTVITNSLITINEAVLASGKVATASLKNKAVTEDKIDFTTIGYNASDTETLGNLSGSADTDFFNTGGMLTSSSRNICFSLTLPKSLSKISTVTVADSKVWVRHVGGGYLLNGEPLTNGGTVSVGIVGENIVSIVIVKGASWSATNNTPISITGAIKLSFS